MFFVLQLLKKCGEALFSILLETVFVAKIEIKSQPLEIRTVLFRPDTFLFDKRGILLDDIGWKFYHVELSCFCLSLKIECYPVRKRIAYPDTHCQ